MGLIQKIRQIGYKSGIVHNEFDQLLRRARKRNVMRILVVWNRGLGDIALGLYALIERVRTFIPNGEITFITRSDLYEAFLLLENIHVIGIPWWERGKAVDLKETLRKLNLSEDSFDLILDKINPTKWFPWQIGHLIPRLKWKKEYDNLWRRFDLDTSFTYVGAHVNTETGQFYGYKKDWPKEKWKELFNSICKNDIKIILFGLKKDNLEKDNPFVIDLRGETGLLEMLSVIKNCCKVLIAPDGGVLSISYYLDASFPITVISLWSDPCQGILKQAVPSPNPGLLHIPLIGKDDDVSTIGVDEVLEALNRLTNIRVRG